MFSCDEWRFPVTNAVVISEEHSSWSTRAALPSVVRTSHTVVVLSYVWCRWNASSVTDSVIVVDACVWDHWTTTTVPDLCWTAVCFRCVSMRSVNFGVTDKSRCHVDMLRLVFIIYCQKRHYDVFCFWRDLLQTISINLDISSNITNFDNKYQKSVVLEYLCLKWTSYTFTTTHFQLINL